MEKVSGVVRVLARKSFLILGLYLLLAGQCFPAQKALTECALPDGGLSLSSTLSTLADPDLALDLAAARQRYSMGDFRPHGTGTPSYGFVKGALWARVRLPAASEACTSLFVIEQPRTNSVELFVIRHSDSVERLTLGITVPFAERAIPHRFPNFRIAREAGEPLDIFLRVRSASSVQLPLHLDSEASLYRQAHNEQAGMGIYYGMLLALFLYSVAVMIGIRDASYFYYVLYLVALCLFSLSFTGHGYQYLWPDSSQWQIASLPLALGALLACGGSFAISFLDLARMAPRVAWMLRLVIVLVVPATLTGLFQLGMTPSTMALTALLIPGSVLVTVGAILSAIRGYRPANYFLFAWCLQLLGGVAVPLSAFGWIPRTLATEYGLQIGSAAEMILLSFALVYRINLLRDRKEKAEREAEREAGRLNLEEGLKRSLEERNTILENSMVAIIFLNAEGRVQWANQAMHKLFGVAPGNYVGKSLEPYYTSHEEYLQVGGVVATAVSRGEAYEDERPMRREDGSQIWVYTSGRAVNPKDASQGTVWAVMDITRRRQLEESLGRSEEQYRQVVNNVSEGMIVVQDGKFIFVNTALLSLLGYDAEEIMGQDFLRVVHPDDRHKILDNDTRRLRGEQFESKSDFRALHKSGKPIWVQISTVMVEWNKQPATLSFISDITQRKQAEDEIREALENQKELNQLKSRFVSIASHEFRTPLTTILSSADLLRHYSERMQPDERIKMLDKIDTAVKRMTGMIDDILIIGKSEADRAEFSPRSLPLRPFCESVANEVRIAAEVEAPARHIIDFQIIGAEGNGGEALFDEKLLRHILSNLLSNAIKYSPKGGRVFFGVVCRPQNIEFTVADEGIGMPEKDLSRLFETFYRASNVGSISGTGLGLSIVKRSVDLHGGTIKVDSVLGTGSRFVVTLPRTYSPAEQDATPQSGSVVKA